MIQIHIVTIIGIAVISAVIGLLVGIEWQKSIDSKMMEEMRSQLLDMYENDYEQID